MSNSSSFSLFSQILDIVELKRESEGSKSVFRLLNAILAQPFPHPGDTITVKTFSLDAEKNDGQIKSEVFRLTRSDNDYEYLEYVSDTSGTIIIIIYCGRLKDESEWI